MDVSSFGGTIVKALKIISEKQPSSLIIPREFRIVRTMDKRDIRVERLDEELIEVYRAMTPAERLQQAFSMWRYARIQIYHSVKALHPDWPEDTIHKEVAKRMSHGNL